MTSTCTYTYEIDLASVLGSVTRARGGRKGVQEFLSTDPLASTYPMWSPYAFAANTPIQAIDLDGLEMLFVQVGGRVGFGLPPIGGTIAGALGVGIIWEEDSTWDKPTFIVYYDKSIGAALGGGIDAGVEFGGNLGVESVETLSEGIGINAGGFLDWEGRLGSAELNLILGESKPREKKKGEYWGKRKPDNEADFGAGLTVGPTASGAGAGGLVYLEANFTNVLFEASTLEEAEAELDRIGQELLNDLGVTPEQFEQLRAQVEQIGENAEEIFEFFNQNIEDSTVIPNVKHQLKQRELEKAKQKEEQEGG